MSPIKEPCFFASELRPENFAPEEQPRLRQERRELEEYLAGPMTGKRFGGLVADWNAYLSLFRGVTTEKAAGEASVCYLWSPTAAANIRTRIPHARIIMVLRDPADRAYSQYQHALSIGLVRKTFREHIEANLRDTNRLFGTAYPLLELGLYSRQIRRYTTQFRPDQVRIYLYGDVDLADVFRFLDVDPGFQPDTSKRHLEVGIPRLLGFTGVLKRSGLWRRLKQMTPNTLQPVFRRLLVRPPGSTPMPAEDRAFLVAYYRDDIRDLETLLNRDLSAWLDPVPGKITARQF